LGNRARLLLAALLAFATLIPVAIASAVTPATLSVSVAGVKHGKAPILGKVTGRGTLTPYAAGQEVTVSLVRDGHDEQSRTVAVGAGGAFQATFRIDGDGGWRVHAVHAASPELDAAEAFSAPFGVAYPTLHDGSHGPDVKLFNRLLQKLGYTASDSGRYTSTTGRGVMALRKVNGMRRTYDTASPLIFKMLVQGRGGYTVHHPDAGRHAEVSLRRQILVLAQGDEVFRIYHVSTGASATPTIRGSFNFYRRQPGYNAKGMYYSFYFHGGYAIHGYKDVPTYPASHGCVRTPIPDQRKIYDWLQMGDPIFVQ
jgi:lipoprotein-anchoring transpeptidase ErfK/SrfK